MKLRSIRFGQRAALALLAAISSVTWSWANATAADVVKVFQETEETFANPGQGWMTTRRLPDGPGRFPYSVAYFRLNWEEIEPAEGQYNWRLIDETLAAWAKREARIAFRIMTTNAHSRGYYCSPKWLFDAGCKSYDYVEGGADITSGGTRINRIEPDYSDPVYLEKHGRFLKVLAERYDGNPQVEFLDIGSYGIWGEWHTKHPQPWTVRKQIIDMYLNGFHKTPLASMSDDAEALAYALAKGTGFRRDGVGSPWHEANWIGSQKYSQVQGFADHWKRAPVIFEWYGPYDYLLQRGWSFDRALDFMEANHVTLINDNVGKVPPDQMPKLERIGRRAGYRFVLRDVSHPDSLARGETLTVNMKWSNVGVGKLYRRYLLVLYLLDAKGEIACRQVQGDVDPTRWLPGDQSVAASLPVPANLQAGQYTLGLALLDPATEVARETGFASSRSSWRSDRSEPAHVGALNSARRTIQRDLSRTMMSRRKLLPLAVLVVLIGILSRSWVVSLAPTTNAMDRFTPPGEKQRRSAIGSTAGLPPRMQRAFDPADHFEPIPTPGPSDWLAKHPEPGQTFAQYRQERANRPDRMRRKLYLQPLGEFPADTSPSLEQLKQFAEAFFTLPVELRPAVNLKGLPITSRMRSGRQQLLTSDILTWLQTRLPKDAYCILAITMADLYPADDWNYVFGQASLRERVGMYGFARYDPGFYGEARGDGAGKLILLRSCKVLAHETGHMFGLQHCVHFRCLMNGSNHLGESDDCPPHLCPVCLRKLEHAVGFDIPARYEQLQAFSQQAGFNDEAAWITRRLEYITEPAPQKHPAP